MNFLGLLREGSGTPYVILEDRGRARWALPADSPSVLRTALSVHIPSTATGMIRWRLARLAAGAGLGGLLPGRRTQAEVPVARTLAAALRLDDRRIAIAESFAGDRCVLLMIDPSGRPRAFVKVTPFPDQVARLEQERDTLGSLNGLRETVSVPNPLYCGPMGDYWSLALTPIHTRTDVRTWRLDEKRVDAAAAIFGAKRGQSELTDRLPSSKVEDLRWADRVNRVRSLLADPRRRPVPLGLCHGDFAPWNVFVHGSRVGVLDWEAADRQGLPFWDLWHFAVSAVHVVPPAMASRPIREALRGRGSLVPLLRRYALRAGVPIESARAVLILYLTLSGLDLLATVKKGRRDHAEGLTSRERLLDEALEVLR